MYVTGLCVMELLDRQLSGPSNINSNIYQSEWDNRIIRLLSIYFNNQNTILTISTFDSPASVTSYIMLKPQALDRLSHWSIMKAKYLSYKSLKSLMGLKRRHLMYMTRRPMGVRFVYECHDF